MSVGWKRLAMDQLQQHEAVCLAADNLESALKELRITGPLGSDQRLDAMAQKRAMTARAESCRRRADRVDRALMVLSPHQRLVLEMLCVRPQKGNVDRLCSILGCEKSTVYRRRDKALRQFAAALYGLR